MLKKIFAIILMLALNNCGYKVIKDSGYAGLKISNINIEGEKRINFNLKNNILALLTIDNSGPISLEINTEKERSIKEKNIKNEITKSQLKITTKVIVITDGINRSQPILFIKNGDYIASDQRSQTLNNEKQLVKRLSESLASDIVEMLKDFK